jgi:hypothetical protein
MRVGMVETTTATDPVTEEEIEMLEEDWGE